MLRHQVAVLRRKVRGRVEFTNGDRWFFIQLYRWFPSVLKVITVIRPETLVRWHRAGFRRYWRWKSRSLGGRPQISANLRALIRRMSVENPLWGAPRIHGELLKLGFEVAQSSVAKYMVKRYGPPSQGWLTFLLNHAPASANRGIPLGRGSALPDPRSRSSLRCRRYTPTASHGYPGQAYRAGIALAERVRRTADRINQARVHRPYHRGRRGALAPSPAILCALL